MQVMFLDESGDHNLELKKIDASYPIFVLAGCIFDSDYYQSVVSPGLEKIKIKYFNDSNIILHTAEMIRPANSKEKRFGKFTDKEFRESFYVELNQFFQKINFKLVACAIKKKEHAEKYGPSALDPYLLSFDNLLNRFIFQIKSPDKGIIYAERRNSILDNQLDIAWVNTKISGTRLVKSSEIKDKIDNFKIVSKSRNEIGLQIADLAVSPVGRNILGIRPKPNNEVDFEVIKKKFICHNGHLENCGLTILPK